MATNKNTAKTAVKNTDKKSKKSDAEKFTELANIRVPKALRVLKSISSLANDTKYKYTDAQSTAIISALKSAVDDLSECFKNGGNQDEETFRI
ncbi:hypothetical protein [Endozoicomonas acroporae]|uniref:hypothetical protein n=1 Tax=Endozoicomonas acroporae TaxID=1701104 RepID=UPI0013D6B767|nr:hypothetical protein [Endozoicomonas acroporae]